MQLKTLVSGVVLLAAAGIGGYLWQQQDEPAAGAATTGAQSAGPQGAETALHKPAQGLLAAVKTVDHAELAGRVAQVVRAAIHGMQQCRCG